MPKPIKAKDVWRTKSWYTILAPKMFGQAEIGETPADDPNKLIGRTIESTLKDLTGDFTKQNIKLMFQVNNIEGATAHTKFIGHKLARDYIRSQVRRGSSRVDAIVDVTTKDGYKLRIKGVAFSAHRANTSQEDSIRVTMINVIEKASSEKNYEQLIQEIVLGKLSEDIRRQVKLIFPLRRIEIRKTELLAEPLT
ncbi:MAG: 30S ribosomal protein S3ae [Euryarchaeota archaeon]|nr:30S ribosomal protein S3ae [Euryarchaeota archaeon]